MKSRTRCLILVPLLASAVAGRSAAQAGASADTTGGKSNRGPRRRDHRVPDAAQRLRSLCLRQRRAGRQKGVLLDVLEHLGSSPRRSAGYTTRIRSTSISSSIPIRVRRCTVSRDRADHDFWTSLAHANIGSFVWKMAGETDPPSINDMITTGQAGSLLGEALYRMADLVLERPTPSGKTSRWRGYVADAISPPRGLNRRVFGERFRAQLADNAPATSWQIRLGANLDAVAHDYSAPVTLLNRDATAEFWMSYGLPGKAGYAYTRPLDYFDFQFSALSNASNPIENVMIRGLLVGAKDARRPRNSRGIWGLYGSYDYISPFLFRVSSTACHSARRVSTGSCRASRFKARCSAASGMARPGRRP